MLFFSTLRIGRVPGGLLLGALQNFFGLAPEELQDTAHVLPQKFGYLAPARITSRHGPRSLSLGFECQFRNRRLRSV
jgi:hypothetical protein